MSNHDCPTCQKTQQFRDALERVPENDKKFWGDIFSALFNTEADRDYYRALVDGNWPNADEVIAKHRANHTKTEGK